MRTLKNIRIPSPSSDKTGNNLWCVRLNENEEIVSLNPLSSEFSIDGEDWKGDLLSPRAIDLQINGGLGLTFTEINLEHLPKLIELLDFLWAEGIEAIAPTLVSCSITSLRNSLAVFHVARQQISDSRCKLLGAHLEGPFLSKSYKGVHNKHNICLPSLNALDARIRGFENEISLVTLAPELKGAFELISRLKSLGILVSLGHSAADSKVCSSAFDVGIKMLTHTFNAMPGLHHRAPGPIAEALAHGGIAFGLIADGFHVHSRLAVMLHRLASDQLVLVSDALPPYGLNQKQFTWDNKLLIVDEGVCRLEDGTLAGTTLSLLEGCKRLARWTDNPASAIWSATIAPRLLFKKEAMIKEFFIGQPLNSFLRWDLNTGSHLLNWKPAA